MSEALLRATGLQAGYGAPVVGPLSFRVEAGEVLGLSGPNGAGKSTLLKAAANGVRIFAGEIWRKNGLLVGWMEQQPTRLVEMPFNGWEYLRYTQAERQPPPAHLARWLDQRVDALSGGQFQLLCLWAVLAGPAELLLLDEPTNNLDRDGEQIVEQALAADQGGRAVVVVSHERAFLERIADRVLEVGG